MGFLSGLVGQGGYLILSLPASVLLARALGPDVKGSVDLALLLPAMITLLVNCGLGSAAAYLIGSRRFPDEEIIGTLGWTWLIISGLVLPTYLLLGATGWLGLLVPKVPGPLLLVASLIIPVSLGQQYLASVMLGRQSFITYNSIQVLTATFNLAGILILVWWLNLSGMGAVMSFLLAQCAALIFLCSRLGGAWGGWPTWRRDVFKEAMSYGVRGQAGNILQFFNYRLDVILLGYLRPLREVGLYSLAVTLAEFLWYIPNASSLVIFPRTAASRDEAGTFTPRVFRITGILTLVVATALALVAGPFIRLAYGAAFSDSVAPFYLLLPGVVCLGGAKVLAADLSGRGSPQYNAMAALLSLLVTLVLDFLLIPAYGAPGAAVASSVAYLASLLYTLHAYGRVVPFSRAVLFKFHGSDLRELRETAIRLSRGERS